MQDVNGAQWQREEAFGAAVWIALVTVATVLGTLAIACAAPLVAMATIAGLKMRKWDGLALVGSVWLANQVVGYLILDYPQTWDSFGWGAAMGLGSLAAFVATRFVAGVRLPHLALVPAAFAAAFLAYEGVLYAARLVLPSYDGFSAAAMLEVVASNVVALALLFAAYRVALMLQLLKPTPAVAPSLA